MSNCTLVYCDFKFLMFCNGGSGGGNSNGGGYDSGRTSGGGEREGERLMEVMQVVVMYDNQQLLTLT